MHAARNGHLDVVKYVTDGGCAALGGSISSRWWIVRFTGWAARGEPQPTKAAEVPAAAETLWLDGNLRPA